MTKGPILIVVNAFEHDAPTRLMTRVARGVREAGSRTVHMAAISRGGPAEAMAAEATGSPANVHVLNAGGPSELLLGRRLSELIGRIDPVIVHASLLRPTLMPSRGAGHATVITCHGTHEWAEARPLPRRLVAAWYARAASRARAVVAVSRETGQELAMAGVPDRLLRVISNGVDPDAFQPASTAADGHSTFAPAVLSDGAAMAVEAPEPNHPLFVVGSAGGLRPVKGYDDLMAAALAVSPDIPGLWLRMWGDGPERGRLQAMIDRAPLNFRASLEGVAAGMAPHLRGLSVFVQPSRAESFGLAVAEAMACGIPVIARRVGGLPELVGEGADAGGVLFDDTAGLADALRALAADSALRARLGANGRARVLASFTERAMVESYLALYDEVAR